MRSRDYDMVRCHHIHSSTRMISHSTANSQCSFLLVSRALLRQPVVCSTHFSFVSQRKQARPALLARHLGETAQPERAAKAEQQQIKGPKKVALFVYYGRDFSSNPFHHHASIACRPTGRVQSFFATGGELHSICEGRTRPQK